MLLQAQREAEKGKQAAGFGSEQVLKKSQNVFKVSPSPDMSANAVDECSLVQAPSIFIVLSPGMFKAQKLA